MRFCLLAAIIISCSQIANASKEKAYTTVPDTLVLAGWQAGQTVTAEAVEAFGGLDRCFASEPIPDHMWQRMQGKTYKENPHIGRKDLRHVRVLHWDYDQKIHIGEMIVNQQIADVVVRIFRQLYNAKYPIQRMVLPDVYDADDDRQMDDNNTSCFCYRTVSGTNKLSLHARGLAIDINPFYNPYCRKNKKGTLLVSPQKARKYTNRNGNFPYKIDRQDLCYRLFTEAGFEWGGNWKTKKDYQHFEIKLPR